MFNCSQLKVGDRVWVGKLYSDGSGRQIKTIAKVTAAQIDIDWNGNDKYLTRYRRDSGYAIGGGIADNITGLATLAECASWDAKQEREHKAARAQGGRGSGHRKEGELYT